MALRFSVIIPVYNGEHFIARAIDSVLAQSYPAHEIIVVNDGSRDKTAEVLERFGTRVRVLTVPNGGVSNARNQGIKIATGDWVSFLDADDIWKVNKLERTNYYLDQCPQVGFVCCNYHLFNPYLKKVVEHFDVLAPYAVAFNAPVRGLEALKLLAELNFVGTASTVAIKKEVLDRVGLFNTAYRQAEDFELWMRTAMVTDFILLSEVLVDKKTHADNLTNNQFEMNSYHKTVLCDFMRTHKAHIDEHHLRPAFLDALSVTNYKLAEIAFNLGRSGESFRLYWQSFLAHKTLKNFLKSFWGITKKSIRCLSFGLINRNKLRDMIK